MDILIHPQRLRGELYPISSKSLMHRYLLCAAFADRETDLICTPACKDVTATMNCICALGAKITTLTNGYRITPISRLPKKATLPCGESGSTLRFLLPIVGALGIEATFLLEGRLPLRPVDSLVAVMSQMGCQFSQPNNASIICSGRLQPGEYKIDPNVSSQYITGLIYGLSLLQQDSRITLLGELTSASYVSMTLQVLSEFNLHCDGTTIPGGRQLFSPGTIAVEGDWSNAAFFAAASAMGSLVSVLGLRNDSVQGDAAISNLLHKLRSNAIISAQNIPDLIPILSVYAAYMKGATFTEIHRLRTKESDRVDAIVQMLTSFGIQAVAADNTLRVFPGKFHGATIDSVNDHRIAMSAAIAATVADGSVIIQNAHCVDKSYPTFWEEYSRLGGQYEQYIR